MTWRVQFGAESVMTHQFLRPDVDETQTANADGHERRVVAQLGYLDPCGVGGTYESRFLIELRHTRSKCGRPPPALCIGRNEEASSRQRGFGSDRGDRPSSRQASITVIVRPGAPSFKSTCLPLMVACCGWTEPPDDMRRVRLSCARARTRPHTLPTETNAIARERKNRTRAADTHSSRGWEGNEGQEREIERDRRTHSRQSDVEDIVGDLDFFDCVCCVRETEERYVWLHSMHLLVTSPPTLLLDQRHKRQC